jgi:hypothetical protein
MVTVPVRALVDVFAAMVNDAVPLPDVVPLGVVIQVALLTELHPHPAAVVTAVLPEPPVAAMFCDAGDRLNAQVPL